MKSSEFEILSTIIKKRRSVSWAKMNGQLIPDAQINQLLELAHWAPTHGRTEPWKFLVYAGESRKTFGKTHAELYWNHTPEDKRQETTYTKLLHNTDLASHLVIAVMKRGENPKIPQIEEVTAASAAIQNLLLGAQALGISTLWSTGGLAHSHILKEHLQLGADDIVMGLIFLGYTDEPVKDGIRNSQFTDKVQWM
jgi:nitroreductase